MQSTVRRWIALGLGAVAVAMAAGLVQYALSSDVDRGRRVGAAAEASLRRRARPNARPPHFEVPLERVSRVHVAVQATARAESLAEDAPQERAVNVQVLLDTGASLPFATAHGALRLSMRMGGAPAGARSFSGTRGTLYRLEEGDELSVSLLPRSDPRAVITGIYHLAPTTLHGAEIIAPPGQLAPIGGAVAIDLVRNRLRICETLETCRPGKGWRPLSASTCPGDPGVVGVDARINGKPAQLHLDLGAPTLVYRRFYEEAGFEGVETQPGRLSGIAGEAPDAEIASGRWRFELGPSRGLGRQVGVLWVVGFEAQSEVVECFPAGSVGLDLFEGCEIALGEAAPRRGWVRCSENTEGDQGPPMPTVQ